MNRHGQSSPKRWCIPPNPVSLHLVLFGLWLVLNLGWLPLPRFDPTFVILASIEAIFRSTFVLIVRIV